ncbi:zinc-dependent metalloprotease [Penaeicola halotolerans]|uniref:zinc-dependent metalloprotease n=1 Tax=Penaeicola halotolerans TaxID=2793196 RepID=UPI001CF84591|nr:zinc-dependent metalloprotease [Penaeicola halotolerans]
MKQFCFKVLLSLLFITSIVTTHAQNEKSSNEQKWDKMTRYEGYFNFYWDDDKGKIWLIIDKLDEQFLYVNSLSAGLGSNDIGLDRGQLGDTRVVEFRKSGSKILLVQPNLDYRAVSDNPDEIRAVKEAFAESVLWGFEVAEKVGDGYAVDATNFFLQDAHGVAETLRRSNQGTYRVEASRSAIYLPQTKNFPENTEFEATITFTGTGAGGNLRSVTPSPDAVSVRMHHSFVKLPDTGFETRAFDPRAGYFSRSYMDYATPIGEPIVKRMIVRHRLKKKNPNAAISDPVEPIVYYLDRGAPEPVRSALLDGGNWWKDAFEAAGFSNAFRVELLPEGADPMDVRYNLIQWVHRSTRGWSYGASVVDPRTGEIIKGHVSLGSLRVRQDILIAQGLLMPYAKGEKADPRMEQMAIARLKQLSAHEIGHTLGLAHNYAASTANDASVMDYPHPKYVMDKDGNLDFSNSYDDKIAAWDKVAINYGYREFGPEEDEKAALNKILEEAEKQGLYFISDADSRAAGGGHPSAHLWDNGPDPVAELHRLMDIRSKKLAEFSPSVIKSGEPLATMEEYLVPLYLMHRYQAEAAVKLIGGLDYRYKLKGDNQPEMRVLDPKLQNNSLAAMMRVIDPNTLILPENILSTIPPRPIGYGRGRETFPTQNGITIDPVAIAESASRPFIQLMLHPERANRLIQQKAIYGKSYLGFDDVLNKMTDELVRSSRYEENLRGLILLQVQKIYFTELINLAKNPNASLTVRGMAADEAKTMKGIVSGSLRYTDALGRAHQNTLDQIYSALDTNFQVISPSRTQETPPGAPIGQTEDQWIGCDIEW